MHGPAANSSVLTPLLLLDYFSTETPTTVFGDKLRSQVEERLAFFESGETPRKNIDVMKEALAEVGTEKMDTSFVEYVQPSFLGSIRIICLLWEGGISLVH